MAGARGDVPLCWFDPAWIQSGRSGLVARDRGLKGDQPGWAVWCLACGSAVLPVWAVRLVVGGFPWLWAGVGLQASAS